MMLEKHAVIATDEAARFVRMLCKHFAHKVKADWDEQRGWVEFAMGRCEMRAKASDFQVRCQAANQSDLEEVADTIKSHFDRFAQRQGLILNWCE
jgi:hypothetical protein